MCHARVYAQKTEKALIEISEKLYKQGMTPKEIINACNTHNTNLLAVNCTFEESSCVWSWHQAMNADSLDVLYREMVGINNYKNNVITSSDSRFFELDNCVVRHNGEYGDGIKDYALGHRIGGSNGDFITSLTLRSVDFQGGHFKGFISLFCRELNGHNINISGLTFNGKPLDPVSNIFTRDTDKGDHIKLITSSYQVNDLANYVRELAGNSFADLMTVGSLRVEQGIRVAGGAMITASEFGKHADGNLLIENHLKTSDIRFSTFQPYNVLGGAEYNPLPKYAGTIGMAYPANVQLMEGTITLTKGDTSVLGINTEFKKLIRNNRWIRIIHNDTKYDLKCTNPSTDTSLQLSAVSPIDFDGVFSVLNNDSPFGQKTHNHLSFEALNAGDKLYLILELEDFEGGRQASNMTYLSGFIGIVNKGANNNWQNKYIEMEIAQAPRAAAGDVFERVEYSFTDKFNASHANVDVAANSFVHLPNTQISQNICFEFELSGNPIHQDFYVQSMMSFNVKSIRITANKPDYVI